MRRPYGLRTIRPQEAQQDACAHVVAGTAHAPLGATRRRAPQTEQRPRTAFGCLDHEKGKAQPMITLAEHMAEAQRELALRRKCYPQWIKSGKLDAQDAYHQLQCIEAILRTLQRLDAEQRQLSLFGTRA